MPKTGCSPQSYSWRTLPHHEWTVSLSTCACHWAQAREDICKNRIMKLDVEAKVLAAWYPAQSVLAAVPYSRSIQSLQAPPRFLGAFKPQRPHSLMVRCRANPQVRGSSPRPPIDFLACHVFVGSQFQEIEVLSDDVIFLKIAAALSSVFLPCF